MTDIFILIIEDRHRTTDALPFSTEAGALAAAEAYLAGCGDPGEVERHDLNQGMISDRWAFYANYGIEGDSVHVIRRALDAAP